MSSRRAATEASPPWLVLAAVLCGWPPVTAWAEAPPADGQTAAIVTESAAAPPAGEPSPYPGLEARPAEAEDRASPPPDLADLAPEPATSPAQAAAEPASPRAAEATPEAHAGGTTIVAAAPEPFHVPIIRNEKVEPHIRFFNVAIRDRFEKWLERLGSYWPHVESIFREFDLPSDLVYLSLVESGFNPHAYSRAKATGPWQFMKGTARVYGLRVDDYVDERRDPIKSTVAAARYLRDLYDLFGTWPLALAAYNAGEGKVQRALEKARAESFWEIAQTRHLRRETKDYVPRYFAATIIAKNPDEYGFSSLNPDLHQYEEVAVRRPLHLSDIAKASGVSYAELRRLNPELRRDVTPPTDPVYFLKVPVDMKERIERSLDQVPTWKPTPVKAKRKAPPILRKGRGAERGDSVKRYQVKAGDNLSKIAKRFRTSVDDLMAMNKLRAPQVKPGDRIAVPR